jgi:hypothetical protein
MDWQLAIVGLIILGALIYVGRRAFARLYGFLRPGSDSGACETACGKCEASTASSTQRSSANRVVMVDLTRTKR